MQGMDHAEPTPITIERIVDGLQAQLERTEKFDDAVDLGRAAETYRLVAELLHKHLHELRTDIGLPPKAPFGARHLARQSARQAFADRPVPTQVYTYWDSPVTNAPPLVQACLNQLLRVHPDAKILNGEGVRELIDLPDRVVTLLEKDRPAHFSDYVRTKILETHGGIWVDATAWVPRPLSPEVIGPMLRGGTILPRYGARLIANWFIASQPNATVISLMRRGLDLWWGTRDDLPDYFLYHRIFDVLGVMIPEFDGEWSLTPTLSTTATRWLQLAMMMPYDEKRFRHVIDSAPLQKLSYKYDRVPPGSVLEHLLKGAIPN